MKTHFYPGEPPRQGFPGRIRWWDWLLGNWDDGMFGEFDGSSDHGMPWNPERHLWRGLIWILRNPLHNWNAYGRGHKHRPHTTHGDWPDRVFGPGGGTNRTWYEIAGQRYEFESYCGPWRPFGITVPGYNVRRYRGWRPGGMYGWRYTIHRQPCPEA